MDQTILGDLFGKLQESETLKPATTPVGLWRTIMNSRHIKVAAAAVVALAIMLPVSYGAIKAIEKYFIVQDTVTFEYPEPNGVSISHMMVGRGISVANADANSQQEAQAKVKFTEEEKAQLKQQSDEIHELAKAGKGERTFWKEVEENGMHIRLYQVRYTLSDGQVVTVCEGEAVK